MLAFAITFEMPIFAFFLTRLGIIDYKMMLKQFRYAILIIFVVVSRADAARHGLAIPARDSAAAALRLSASASRTCFAIKPRNPPRPLENRNNLKSSELGAHRANPMARIVNIPSASGAPGIPPRWTRSAKDIVGTAYSTSSRHLVHGLGRRHQRDLFPDHRFAAGPRPAVPGQRRRKFFPRRTPRHASPTPSTSTTMASACASSSRDRRRPLPHLQGDHRRSASARAC